MDDYKKATDSLYNIFFDICIIGGGAAGMAAAITALETNPSLSVCIIEKKEELGKKILATGNGRCNITNTAAEGFDTVKHFLSKSNILIKEEAEGRMYPLSEQALVIPELLKYTAKEFGAAVFNNCRVVGIEKYKEGNFKVNIDCAGEKVFIPCKKVLLSCGGKAAPHFGTTGDGYAIAKSFGHSVERIRPILMPLECENIDKALKGVRAKVKASLIKNEELIAEEAGELQFTSDGLSGICIFNLTRYITLEGDVGNDLVSAFREYEIEIDYIPDMEEEHVLELLEERRNQMSFMPSGMFLHSILNSRLGEILINEVVKNSKTTIGRLTDEEIEEITMLLKSSRYTVTGAKGWKEAQCTAGGVSKEEINQDTMESTQTLNLYFAGEIINYDGPCGGFNLNHSWLTGIKAGYAMAVNLTERTGI